MSDILFKDVHSNKYSKRVFGESPYQAKDVWNSLNWDKAHHKWRKEEKMWECDLTALPYLIQVFRNEGYSVDVVEEVENVYEDKTGFKLYPEKIALHVSELHGAELEVIQQGEEFSISSAGDYEVDKGSRVVSKVTAQGDHEVSIKLSTGESEEAVELLADKDRVTVNPADVTEGIDNLLDAELSYQVQGYEHIEAYQRGHWDGKEHMYSVQGHLAPVGLLRRVKSVLEDNGHNIEVVDKRDAPEPGEIDYQWNFEYDLRDYQSQAISQGLSTQGGVMNLPTGAGKTICGLKLIQELGHKAIILVHKKDLLYQWVDEIEENLGRMPGIIGDGEWSESKITVAMMQTLSERGIERLREDYEVLIGDECHHVPADTFFEVSSGLDAYYKFGLSATAYRNDNADMKIFAGVGDITAQITAEELIEEGYLAEPEFEEIDYEAEFFPSSDYNENRRQLRQSGNRNKAIVDKAQELAEDGYKVLIDVTRVEHGDYLSKVLNTEFVYGETPSDERERIVSEFQEDDRDILVSTLLDEGVDIPELNAIILADAGKSSIRTIQTIGRALRPKNGDKALILDMHDLGKGKYASRHYKERQNTMQTYYGKYYGDDNDV